jgi:cellulose synthase/poly-beta-1,6-N-acetylglucosamine synthase-like glycosyltransferase
VRAGLRGAAGITITMGLSLFALRRIVFTIAALAPARREPRDAAPMSVSLVVPARNEGPGLERLLQSLAEIDGPPVDVVLVDDGSGDDTAAVMGAWTESRQRWSTISLRPGVGKGAALNAGIGVHATSQLVAVCDADVRLEPDCLVELTRVFNDPHVGAAGAVLWPANADDSIVTRYCALELWQHQLITSAGKDRLGLNPPALGWLSCYRREALDQIGGFATESLGEDVQATTALVAAGWVSRFVATARVAGDVPGTLADFERQHVRWARGLHDSAPSAVRTRVSAADWVEGWLHAAGYLDRVLLLGAGLLVGFGGLPVWVPVSYLSVAGGQTLCALGRAGELRSSPRFIAAAAAMFTADVAAAATGSLLHLLRLRRSWHSPRRAVGGAPAIC